MAARILSKSRQPPPNEGEPTGRKRAMNQGRPNRYAGVTSNRKPSLYSLFNPFQILRDVFFREAQRSTCAITGQPFTPNLTHHCRAGDATTKLPDILNG